MAHDVGAAMRARRGQGLDGAFEAVERMACAVHSDLESLVIIIAASLASGHGASSLCGWAFHSSTRHRRLKFRCTLVIWPLFIQRSLIGVYSASDVHGEIRSHVCAGAGAARGRAA